jgi:hypothetical protein
MGGLAVYEESGDCSVNDYDVKDCNSCVYFDPITGVCRVTKCEVDPNSEPCERWRYWDD